MPRKDAIDQDTRKRLAAHFHRAFRKFEQDASARGEPSTQAAFADKLGVDAGTVSKILRDAHDSFGFELVLALRRRMGVEYEEMLERDAGAEFEQPFTRGARSPAPPPLSASAREAQRIAAMLARVDDPAVRERITSVVEREIKKATAKPKKKAT